MRFHPNTSSSPLATQRPTLQAAQVVVAGLLALSVAMGIGRFAFTPVLPMMLREGWVDLQGGGWLAMSNYLGYFIGALSCMVLRISPTRMMKVGLCLTVVLTLAMGASHSLVRLSAQPAQWHTLEQWLWLAFRLASGIASAWVFVFASGWGLQTLSQLGRSQIGSLMYCGPGIGIVLSGLSIAVLVPLGVQAATAWWMLAALAFALSAWIWRFLYAPVAPRAHDPAIAPYDALAPPVLPIARRRALHWEIAVLTFAYSLAGFGYIITATFLPVMARQALPGSALNDYFWPIFGASMSIGAWLAARIALNIDQRVLLLISYVMQAFGVSLTIIWPNEWGFALGCIFLGLPYTALVLFAMREGARLAHQMGATPSRLMGLLTAMYGLGQIIGPPLATEGVKLSGSFTPSLLAAAGSLLWGAFIFAGMVKVFPYNRVR